MAVVFWTQFVGRRESPTDARGTIYRHGVTKRGRDEDVDVSRYVAETAERMHERLAEVSSFIRRSLEEDIPELRADARLIELLDASVEGERRDSPARAAVRHRRANASRRRSLPSSTRDGWRNTACPSTRLSAPTGWVSGRMNELVFGELRELDIPAETRFAVLEAITANSLRVHRLDLASRSSIVYEDERERWLENQNSIRGVAGPRGSGRTEGRRRRRDQQLDPLSVAVAPPRRGDVVSGRGCRRRRTRPAAALSSRARPGH